MTYKIVRYLKGTSWWFEVCVRCEKMSRHLVNEHIHHLADLSFFFFFFLLFLAGTLKFYSVSKFHLYNTVLSTIVTVLFFRSLDLIHCIAENLYPFTNLSLSPAPPNLWQLLQTCVCLSNKGFSNFFFLWT